MRRVAFAALEILEQHRDFTVVLMDIVMPIMDGYETIRAGIRKSGHSSGLPIVAVTGKAVGGERHRCLAAGADDYVPKPVSRLRSLILPAGHHTQISPTVHCSAGRPAAARAAHPAEAARRSRVR